MRISPVLFLFLILFLSCQKENIQQEVVESKVLWQTKADHKLWHTDGVIYDHHYMVWANNAKGERLLEVYDIPSRSKDWEHNFDDAPGWGGLLRTVGDTLYFDHLENGFTIFEISTRYIVQSMRLSQNILDWETATPMTYFQGSFYKSIYHNGWEKAYVISISGSSIDTAFQWGSKPGTAFELATPILFYNTAENRTNLLMMVRFRKEDLTLFVSGNKDHSLNWTDTLEDPGESTFPDFNPVRYGNTVITALGDRLYALDIYNGMRRWEKKVSGSTISKIIKRGPDVFIRLGDHTFSKINPSSGETIWTNNTTAPPSFGGLEIQDEHIVFSPSPYSELKIIDNLNGSNQSIDSTISTGFSNPQFYKFGDYFIAHTFDNKIIGFEIE